MFPYITPNRALRDACLQMVFKSVFSYTGLARLDAECTPFWFYLCLSMQPATTGCCSATSIRVSSAVRLLCPRVLFTRSLPWQCQFSTRFKFSSFLYVGVLLKYEQERNGVGRREAVLAWNPSTWEVEPIIPQWAPGQSSMERKWRGLSQSMYLVPQ